MYLLLITILRNNKTIKYIKYTTPEIQKNKDIIKEKLKMENKNKQLFQDIINLVSKHLEHVEMAKKLQDIQDSTNALKHKLEDIGIIKYDTSSLTKIIETNTTLKTICNDSLHVSKSELHTQVRKLIQECYPQGVGSITKDNYLYNIMGLYSVGKECNLDKLVELIITTITFTISNKMTGTLAKMYR